MTKFTAIILKKKTYFQMREIYLPQDMNILFMLIRQLNKWVCFNIRFKYIKLRVNGL